MARGSRRGWIIGSIVVVALLVCCARFVAFHGAREAAVDSAAASYAAAPVPEVMVGTPSWAPPERLALPAYPAGEIAAGDSWPRACSLLTDDEVLRVLPQADRFGRSGGPAQTIKFETAVHPRDPFTGAVDTGYIAKNQAITVPEPSCDIRFWLPHRSLSQEWDRIAGITVRVQAAGDPKIVYGFAFGDYLSMSEADVTFARAHGAVGCRGSATGWRCTRGSLTIEVAGELDGLSGADLQIRMPGQQSRDATEGSRLFVEAVTPIIMARLLAKLA
jgi:hypothetical protein